MVRFKMLVTLIAVISLSLGVIWPDLASAATSADFASLGQVQEGLSVPGSMDIDAQGNLYVADARTNTILKYDAAGTLMKTFTAVPVSGIALAVTVDGTRIYATEGERVIVLDGQTGASLGYLGDLAVVSDIVVDAQGNVYVVDPGNVQIVKYNANGDILNTISGLGAGDGLFRRIDVMAINTASGELYVAGEGVTASTMSGSSIVQIFDFEGAFLGKIVDAAEFGGALAICKGIAFGPDGLEFYLDQLNANIRVRDRATGYLSTKSIKGIGDGLMVLPIDLVYDVTSDRLLVASDNVEVEVFGINGGSTPAVNQAPSIPVPVSPIAGGEAVSTSPQLRFLNSSDANGDAVSYDIELSGSSVNATVQTDGTESYVTVAAPLNENTAYSWKVMARDVRGAESDWSADQVFFVNATNEAPTAPTLLTATAGEELNGSGLLSWTASTDADPNDTITYQLEIAEDITFTEPVILAALNNTESRLDALIDYTALQDGIDYVWRVSAVDQHGLASASNIGSFNYDTAMLTVAANLPDAAVFLGGNSAYAGKRVGVAPIEFRDLAPGAYTVVIERAGCEQFIAQVEISGQNNADVAADLDLAVVSSFKSGGDLRAGKSKLKVGGGAAPFVVDFNNDGMLDLLVGDESGALTLFSALSQRGAKVQYDAGVALNVAGAVPFVVDWNNDNRKDLLVGATDGTFVLYLQSPYSYDLKPQFAAGQMLQIEDLGVGATPAVIDWTGNGVKDLVVGTASGNLYLFENDSEDDAQPKLQEKGQLITSISGAVAPMFVDWDADGQRDLLIGNNGALDIYTVAADGSYASTETVISASAAKADPAARFVVVDIDRQGGKDIFVGYADGSVSLFRSGGRDYQPTVKAALLDKTAQLDGLTDVAALDASIVAIAAAIEDDDLKSAGKLAKALVAAVPTGGEIETAAVELLALLSR